MMQYSNNNKNNYKNYYKINYYILLAAMTYKKYL